MCLEAPRGGARDARQIGDTALRGKRLLPETRRFGSVRQISRGWRHFLRFSRDHREAALAGRSHSGH